MGVKNGATTTVLVDMDDTIAGFTKHALAKLSERTRGRKQVALSDCRLFPLVDNFKDDAATQDALKSIFIEPGFFRDLEPIDGAVDDYSSSVVYTKAMGEGAIEGVAADYEINAVDPYSPTFKYSRFGATKAAPRDTSKLTGVRRVVGTNMPMMAASQGEDEAIQMA